MTPQGQDDHKPLLFQADAHQNPTYINMHFLLDSKCFSAEPTENFQIAYDKVWTSNELIFLKNIFSQIMETICPNTAIIHLP